MKKILAALAVTLIIGTASTTIKAPAGQPDIIEDMAAELSSRSAERFACEVVPLDDYGFEGDLNEYVCADPDNVADFVIIEGAFEPGDNIKAILGNDGRTVKGIADNQ